LYFWNNYNLTSKLLNQMGGKKLIKSALISVYNKDGIEEIADLLLKNNVKIYSTGGTFEFLKSKGIAATEVEDLTKYPSIFGGRVKTLHPAVFGGILFRRDNTSDLEEQKKYNIPNIDLVIVDLYPFEETVLKTSDNAQIIEKIDIGGISLIRAAAKNYQDVVVIPSTKQYDILIKILTENNAQSDISDRMHLAACAFNVSSHYDTQIFNYFNKEANLPVFKHSEVAATQLRYGENPHQDGYFCGNLDNVFEQLHGKAISYNNIVDIDAAITMIHDFSEEPTFVIIKHTNACGVSSRATLSEAWDAALAGDPVSAYGGVIICNKPIDLDTANKMNTLFFEIVLAPNYDKDALEILKSKKNRIILQLNNNFNIVKNQFKSVLNGVIQQQKDFYKHSTDKNWEVKSTVQPNNKQIEDLIFANTVVKHLKSNAIVLVRNKQLLGCGCGMTSRVDAVKQAVNKAKENGLSLKGAVMASDAFFPFSDSAELAHSEGITAIIEPGGSIRDKDTIEFCNKVGIALVFTGIRHFKH
jgi:phosphoribosylaminoimidazolecarboxamide formyltransferase/IMP cyclohydrolase